MICREDLEGAIPLRGEILEKCIDDILDLCESAYCVKDIEEWMNDDNTFKDDGDKQRELKERASEIFKDILLK